MTGDLRNLRQRVELVERPRFLVVDEPGDLELVARRIDLGRLVLAVIGVERKRPGNRAFRIGRRQLVAAEHRRLRAIIESEILRSTPSAVSPSMMSQPVRKVSAPRLAAPRRKLRRIGSGNSLPASVIRSFGSTPGMILRMRMAHFPVDHGAQALGHQQRQQDVHHQEADDRRHGEEVHVARSIVAAEQRGQLLELHRLPDRKARTARSRCPHNDAGIKQLLHGVVDATDRRARA